MRPTPDLRVYLVTDRGLCHGRDPGLVVEEAVSGGATLVQVREKHADTRDFIELARALKNRLQEAGILVLVNDRVDVALAAGAHGVHLGQTDMPAPAARRILGGDAVIGLSMDRLEQVEEANGMDVDYLGVGPVFATSTKPDAGPPLGLEAFSRFVRAARFPVVGIGSINEENAASVVRAGASGVAVVSALCGAENVAAAARALRARVDRALAGR